MKFVETRGNDNGADELKPVTYIVQKAKRNIYARKFTVSRGTR
jgi:hypothetical protein